MGHSLKECASTVGISDTSTIANFVRLMDIVPGYSYLVDWGSTGSSVAFKTAATIAKLNSIDQKVVFDAALKYQLKKTEVEQIVQIRKRSGRQISECIDEIVGMRPRTTVVNIIVGAIESEPLNKRLAAMHQVERDALLRKVIEANFPTLKNISVRQGGTKFTISVDGEDWNLLRSKSDKLEDMVTDGLISLLQ